LLGRIETTITTTTTTTSRKFEDGSENEAIYGMLDHQPTSLEK
jgi:hypothetical protein